MRARAADPKLPVPEIIDPTDIITCIYCKQTFNKKEVIDYVQIKNNQYAHKKCAELEDKREKTDAEKLDDYIMQLFGFEYIPPKVKKQIQSFMEEYDYTYSGIHKALKYFYEIKGNSIKKANDGIGIVPYIYRDAYNYYYSLWLANQKNENKNISEYIPEVIEVRIPVPKRDVKKRKLFSFLDEEVENNE